MFDGFYCYDCKREFDELSTKSGQPYLGCPHCGSDNITEVIDGELVSSNKNNNSENDDLSE